MKEETKQYLENNAQYWIGRLEMATEFVAIYSKLKTRWGREQLKKAKAGQKEAIEKIKELTR